MYVYMQLMPPDIGWPGSLFLIWYNNAYKVTELFKTKYCPQETLNIYPIIQNWLVTYAVLVSDNIENSNINN